MNNFQYIQCNYPALVSVLKKESVLTAHIINDVIGLLETIQGTPQTKCVFDRISYINKSLEVLTASIRIEKKESKPTPPR